MRKIPYFLYDSWKGPSYLIRLAIKRTPGGPNAFFNETRIFVGRGDAPSKEREGGKEKKKQQSRLHFAPDLLFLFSVIPRFPHLVSTGSRGFFFFRFFIHSH